MDATSQPGIEVLDDASCWELLASASVGRIAVDIAGQPDIFPLNYVVADGGIVFRSGPGTKLAGAVLNHHVAFEIDGYLPDERTAWSVVVKGLAHQIEHMMEMFAAEDLPLFPWVASPKPDFVRIEPTLVTGRRFHVVDEVAPDDSLGWQGTSEAPQAPDIAVDPEPGAEFHPGAPHLRPD
jgi:nitroimidazol reductase NimA-like FMN-containing flavoprotein (pyridoxamine 5'-phosphate oxidase superfamily)